MKKILWLSRHEPQNEQIAELLQVFGEVEIVQVAKNIQSGNDVLQLMQDTGADEVVAVLPIPLLQEVLRLGVRPLKAVMKRTLHEDRPATFEHDHFERIERIEVVTTPLIKGVK